MNIDSIVKPTLLLNPQIAQRNLQRMAAKARASQLRLRPHFKTHQSRQIGGWFRAEGVEAITVSSVDMAVYFAADGWQDILIAFSANRREIATINQLARQVRLGLLFEEGDTLQFFLDHLQAPVDVWLEADNGSGRTGIPFTQGARFAQLAGMVSAPHRFMGVLTHAGNTYRAGSPQAILQIYNETLQGLQQVRQELAAAGWPQTQLSCGDTPSLSLVDHIQGVDEIRPGNFIFYDCSQLTYGSCQAQDIAVAVACPVIASYPQRGQVALYGGGVHLSKDYFKLNGSPAYGFVSLLAENGWGEPLPGAYVSGLWQEHALVNLDAQQAAQLHPGDLLAVLPSHSCMTVDLYASYLTTDGENIAIKR